MQALTTIDGPAEQRLCILVKVEIFLFKLPRTRACMETRVSHVRAGMVFERKTTIMPVITASRAVLTDKLTALNLSVILVLYS